jgi:hypothetical protein
VKSVKQMTTSTSDSIQERLSTLDWASIRDDLWRNGFAVTEPVLTGKECRDLVQTYADDSHFRSHIVMARYRFGSGDYKYFAHPLPRRSFKNCGSSRILHSPMLPTSGTRLSACRNASRTDIRSY